MNEKLVLDSSKHPYFISIFKNKFSAKNHAGLIGSVRSNKRIPLVQSFYFEVLIVNGDEVAIGLFPSTFPNDRPTGSLPDSIGYRADGRLFTGDSVGVEYGEHYGTGDIIGCGISSETRDVFFTKNGTHLGIAVKKMGKFTDEWFASISLHGVGEEVTVNFGQGPFRFDLQAMYERSNEVYRDSIDKIRVSPDLSRLLVREYLLFCGYGNTLKALDNATNTSSSQETTKVASASMETDEPVVATAALAEDDRPLPAAGDGDGFGGDGYDDKEVVEDYNSKEEEEEEVECMALEQQQEEDMEEDDVVAFAEYADGPQLQEDDSDSSDQEAGVGVEDGRGSESSVNSRTPADKMSLSLRGLLEGPENRNLTPLWASLWTRTAIRELIRMGDVKGAVSMADNCCQSGKLSRQSMAWAALQCLAFVQLLRKGNTPEAVSLAANELYPFLVGQFPESVAQDEHLVGTKRPRSGSGGGTENGSSIPKGGRTVPPAAAAAAAGSLPDLTRTMIMDTIGLLAWSDATKSPQTALLSVAFLEAVADVVNQQLLVQLGLAPIERPHSTTLHLCCAQLLAVTSTLQTVRGTAATEQSKAILPPVFREEESGRTGLVNSRCRWIEERRVSWPNVS